MKIQPVACINHILYNLQHKIAPERYILLRVSMLMHAEHDIFMADLSVRRNLVLCLNQCTNRPPSTIC